MGSCLLFIFLVRLGYCRLSLSSLREDLSRFFELLTMAARVSSSLPSATDAQDRATANPTELKLLGDLGQPLLAEGRVGNEAQGP
ncbi:hypothetical protein NL676_033606 [Syzygium grande]|nr:hypothetical protein NL676_033606 [Syzygium grande]